jgi:hypothetical protein
MYTSFIGQASRLNEKIYNLGLYTYYIQSLWQRSCRKYINPSGYEWYWFIHKRSIAKERKLIYTEIYVIMN